MRAVIVLLCVSLAACGEPDFDERYAEREKQLASEAAAMERELDRRMTEKPGLEETPAPSATATGTQP